MIEIDRRADAMLLLDSAECFGRCEKLPHSQFAIDDGRSPIGFLPKEVLDRPQKSCSQIPLENADGVFARKNDVG
jgi:hypothetical protein